MRTTPFMAAAAAGCVWSASPAVAQEAPVEPTLAAAAQGDDLAGLTIEQLADIPVTSASKRIEPLSGAPTALFVITSEDILTSGATSLPQALRLAPNLDVQRIDASQWAIAARGFNGVQAGNKLLAVIDGRSIYTPLNSSIFWNLHQPMLEDIQQIEVISGPGGTLHGPNAVNGVISVVTRDARDTIGGLARATYGAGEQTAALRYGLGLGETSALRVYANWASRDGLPQGTGRVTDDDYRGWQAGFRADIAGEHDQLTVQGDLLRSHIDTGDDDGARAHNLLARWTRTIGGNASFQVQAYYDWFKRTFTLAEDSVRTFDGEAQVNVAAGAHDLVAGVGARRTSDEFINNLNIFQLVPNKRRLWVYNAFVQDRWTLSPELALTAGLKVERSTFSGWQLLPNLRLAWQPNEQQLLWAAVSRAVRTPSRIDRELQALPLLAPAPDFTSEKLVALEAGYRGEPAPGFSLSVSGFVNLYDDIRTTEYSGTPLPIMLMNGWKGRTWGVEAWGNAQVTSWWRIGLGVATLSTDFELKDGHAADLAPRNSLGASPRWQLRAQSGFDLAPRLALTLNGRMAGDIDVAPAIDGYAELEGRLGYQLNDEVELFVAGRNLLHRSHAEHNDPNEGQLAKRSLYAGARLQF